MFYCRSVVVFLAVFFFHLTSAHAQSWEWKQHKGAEVKFQIPTNWAEEQVGDSLMIRPASGLVGVEFVAFDDGAKEAKKNMETLLLRIKKRFPDATTTGKPKRMAGTDPSLSRS